MLSTFKVDATERGNSKKNGHAYLDLIKSKTEDSKHPRNMGVSMQAHHAISAKGMDLSGLADKYEDFGYDINQIKNLVFIPCTLQGASLLGVQPHRGNHTAPDVDKPNRDKDKDANYHTMVSDLLQEAYRNIDELCGSGRKDITAETQHMLDEVSETIIDRIQNNPKEARLTALYKHFTRNNKRGCGGVDYVNDKRAVDICPVGRHHTHRQGEFQRDEEISYVGNGKYMLKPGS